jgi:hypothetical protein
MHTSHGYRYCIPKSVTTLIFQLTRSTSRSFEHSHSSHRLLSLHDKNAHTNAPSDYHFAATAKQCSDSHLKKKPHLNNKILAENFDIFIKILI